MWFWTAIIVALVIGATLGLLTAAICFAAAYERRMRARNYGIPSNSGRGR